MTIRDMKGTPLPGPMGLAMGALNPAGTPGG